MQGVSKKVGLKFRARFELFRDCLKMFVPFFFIFFKKFS